MSDYRLLHGFHQDIVKLLDNATGPVEFRITQSFSRMAVSGSGVLKAWTGEGWDSGTSFTGTETITSPGRYQLTLDVPGYASIQEPSPIARK